MLLISSSEFLQHGNCDVPQKCMFPACWILLALFVKCVFWLCLHFLSLVVCTLVLFYAVMTCQTRLIESLGSGLRTYVSIRIGLLRSNRPGLILFPSNGGNCNWTHNGIKLASNCSITRRSTEIATCRVAGIRIRRWHDGCTPSGPCFEGTNFSRTGKRN